MKVLIADDHPLILAAVRRALELSEDVEVVGEARSRAELMALVERRNPQIVLLDLQMPGVEGTDHIEELKRRWPEVKVVVLSASEDAPSVDAAMRAGAGAFLTKGVSPSDLSALLRQVDRGAVFRPAAPAPVNGGSADDGPQLTERERAILSAAARGLTTAEIGRELFISEHTVKFHLTNIYRKLGVSNRAAAVRYALEHKIS